MSMWMLLHRFLLTALETMAIEQAAMNFGGTHNISADDAVSSMTMEVDGLSGLSVTD